MYSLLVRRYKNDIRKLDLFTIKQKPHSFKIRSPMKAYQKDGNKSSRKSTGRPYSNIASSTYESRKKKKLNFSSGYSYDERKPSVARVQKLHSSEKFQNDQKDNAKIPSTPPPKMHHHQKSMHQNQTIYGINETAMWNVKDKEKHLEKRKKMISYGKNTIGYDEYIKQIPKHKRKLHNPDHPRTPDPYENLSWRRFKGQITVWRKKLHIYDPPDLLNNNNNNSIKVDAKSNDEKSIHNNVQEKQIEEATIRGLPVDFTGAKDDNFNTRENHDIEKKLSPSIANAETDKSFQDSDDIHILCDKQVLGNEDCLSDDNDSDDDLL